jgi:Uma2 family endonuclease
MGAGLAYAELAQDELARRWKSLLEDPAAPDRCELNEYGDLIVMNPPSKPHQRIVMALARQLVEQIGGEALPGIGVLTRIGVRLPDLCWAPSLGFGEPTSPAPDICIEVQSESNTRQELDAKLAAYLDAGAREVVLVELTGRIRYFTAQGEQPASSLGVHLSLPAGTYCLGD